MWQATQGDFMHKSAFQMACFFEKASTECVEDKADSAFFADLAARYWTKFATEAARKKMNRCSAFLVQPKICSCGVAFEHVMGTENEQGLWYDCDKCGTTGLLRAGTYKRS